MLMSQDATKKEHLTHLSALMRLGPEAKKEALVTFMSALRDGVMGIDHLAEAIQQTKSYCTPDQFSDLLLFRKALGVTSSEWQKLLTHLEEVYELLPIKGNWRAVAALNYDKPKVIGYLKENYQEIEKVLESLKEVPEATEIPLCKNLTKGRDKITKALAALEPTQPQLERN